MQASEAQLEWLPFKARMMNTTLRIFLMKAAVQPALWKRGNQKGLWLGFLEIM